MEPLHPLQNGRSIGHSPTWSGTRTLSHNSLTNSKPTRISCSIVCIQPQAIKSKSISLSHSGRISWSFWIPRETFLYWRELWSLETSSIMFSIARARWTSLRTCTVSCPRPLLWRISTTKAAPSLGTREYCSTVAVGLKLMRMTLSSGRFLTQCTVI